jgi:uncharacterized membrane protein
MKESKQRKHILYLGDWVFHIGPIFVETPFGMETKDSDLHFYGSRLVQALEPEAEVTCMANWELYRLDPGRLEKILERSSTLIISDVEAKCFHLFPSFFDRSRRENKVITFPDRLKAVKKWIGEGGGLMMFGGWLSFSGSQCKAGWRRSVLAEALPVECLPSEDLVESSEGFTAEVMMPDHPIAKGLPWDSFPPIFGYNELIPKPGSKVIVRVKETGHPLVVTGEYQKGRICIYASDPAPHWGLNFELWEGYNALCRRMVKWTSKTAAVPAFARLKTAVRNHGG